MRLSSAAKTVSRMGNCHRLRCRRTSAAKALYDCFQVCHPVWYYLEPTSKVGFIPMKTLPESSASRHSESSYDVSRFTESVTAR